MRVPLNDEAVSQLEFIMDRTGYTNKQHAIQVMLSTIANNLRRSGQKLNNKVECK
ncbi:hypothetical protein D3C75_724930 [compost metagenome]